MVMWKLWFLARTERDRLSVVRYPTEISWRSTACSGKSDCQTSHLPCPIAACGHDDEEYPCSDYVEEAGLGHSGYSSSGGWCSAEGGKLEVSAACQSGKKCQSTGNISPIGCYHHGGGGSVTGDGGTGTDGGSNCIVVVKASGSGRSRSQKRSIAGDCNVSYADKIRAKLSYRLGGTGGTAGGGTTCYTPSQYQVVSAPSYKSQGASGASQGAEHCGYDCRKKCLRQGMYSNQPTKAYL